MIIVLLMPRNGYKKGRSRGCVQIFPLCSFKFIFSPSLFQIHILSHFLSLELSTLSKIYQHELLRPRECMCQFFFGTDAVQELKAWSSKTASGCKALEESFPQHPRIKCVRKTNRGQMNTHLSKVVTRKWQDNSVDVVWETGRDF